MDTEIKIQEKDYSVDKLSFDGNSNDTHSIDSDLFLRFKRKPIVEEVNTDTAIYADPLDVNQTILRLPAKGTSDMAVVLARSPVIKNDQGNVVVVDHTVPQPLVREGRYVVEYKRGNTCMGEEYSDIMEEYFVQHLDTMQVSEQIKTRNPFNIIEAGTVHPLVLQKLRIIHRIRRKLNWIQKWFTEPWFQESREITIAPGFAHYVLSMHHNVESATSITISQVNTWFSIWNFPTTNSNIPNDTLSYIGVVCKARLEEDKHFFRLARPLLNTIPLK